MSDRKTFRIAHEEARRRAKEAVETSKKHGYITPVLTNKKLTKVMSKVTVEENGCWSYAAGKTTYGYYRIRVFGISTYLHRSIYVTLVGAFDEKLNICHHCDNRGCINPNHLFPGTHADNMADMKKKGRAKSGRYKGQPHPNRKITESDVPGIRADTRPQRVIAEMYGVCQQLISDIKSRKVWTHV